MKLSRRMTIYDGLVTWRLSFVFIGGYALRWSNGIPTYVQAKGGFLIGELTG